MEFARILNMFKPNITSLGYALFLAVGASALWGGVFPFLPMEFQTRKIVFWFYFSQSLACTIAYFASCIGVYEWPRFTRNFLVKAASTPYFLGWCCLIAAIYIDELALALVIAGGILLGVGSVGIYMIWQRIFAGEEAEQGNRNILVGTAYGALFYYGLHLIPQAVTAYLIPLVLLPLFGLSAQLSGRKIDLDQSMFQDIPREHPHVYRQVMVDHWRSALCIGAIGFCAGIMRSMAIADPSVGSLVNILSMGCVFLAIVVLIVAWFFKNIRLDIVGSYRVVFPFLITAFVIVPFLPETSIRWIAAILYALFTAAIVLMMMHCAQVSRDRGINPIFVYAFFGAIVYTLQNIGFIGGSFAEEVRIIGFVPIAIMALISVYALAIMYFIGSGGMTAAIGKAGRVESVELMAISRMDLKRPEASAPSLKVAPQDSKDVSTVQAGIDRIAEQSERLRQAFRLSARETEVMELIARGNSVAKIAEMLVVSENTVRTHSKRIYTKLNIHKRQELIDLIDSF